MFINRKSVIFYMRNEKPSTKMMKSVLFAAVLVALHSSNTTGNYEPLTLDYYKHSCPSAEEIVKRIVEIAVRREPRMAASLLRLHFHDCFVMGCDGSILLDSQDGMVSEKEARPNLNSARGFEVIDSIKEILEEACPVTVSCADILAMVAHDAVSLRGGPRWKVWLGRRDSLKSSFDGANKFIPAPNSSLETLITSFKQQDLDIKDLVSLSGAHTLGKAKCITFNQRLYEEDDSEDAYDRHTTFREILRSICKQTGTDNVLVPLDSTTPARFDNQYFMDLIEGKGLLESDNVLFDEDNREEEVMKLVWDYASDQQLFFAEFATSMINMGNINVLTGNEGEIRRNCRFVNRGN